MACGAHLTGAELNGEGVHGYSIQAGRRSITVAVKCRVAAVTTCCINSSCCDRMGFFSFSIQRLKYNINLPVLLPSALCNCLAAPSLLMDFLSNTSSSSISEKQPLLLNKPSSVTLCSPPSAYSSFYESCLSDIFFFWKCKRNSADYDKSLSFAATDQGWVGGVCGEWRVLHYSCAYF